MSKKLALFDFDGTVTTKDSFLEFLKFYKGYSGFYLGFALLSPYLIAMKLKLIPNWKAKEIVLKYFLNGLEKDKMEQIAQTFTTEIIPSLLRPKALEQIRSHQEKGDDIYLVSASAESWLKFWCEEIGINLIATKLEIVNEKITGKLDGKNCHGPEKVARIKAQIDLHNYSEIYAYGDSSGDTEMLELATHPHYRHF